MNQAKFEKINGREALRRLADGETVYGRDSGVWLMKEDNTIIYKSRHGVTNATVKLNDFVRNKHLHIKKPFDVRQAMLDRPNEWVGAYKGPYGTWYKVGFDGMYMTAIFTELEHKIEATHDTDGVRPIFFDYSRYLSGRDDRTLSVLGSCIPIEDVPEEATR